MHEIAHTTCRCCKRATQRGGGGGDFGGPDARLHYPPDLGLEPVHIAMELRFDLEHRRLDGQVTHHVQARRDGMRELVLDLVDAEVEAVHDVDEAPLVWRYDGSKLTVRWDEAFEVGGARQVTVRYSVTEPATGLVFTGPDAGYPDRAWTAFTDHETERARHWLPCIDLPNVRTTLDIQLRGKADHTLLANGAYKGEELHDDGTRTVRWALDSRCPSYLVCLAVGEFVHAVDAPVGDVPVAYFAPKPATPEDLRRTFGRTGAIMRWMVDLLDMPFPFPKYYQFAADGIGGAMENISLVSWDSLFVIDETLSAEWTWLVDQINVHEMAHSYFGDLVVCRDFAHAWLKESWATYIEQCWLEHSKGDDEALYDFYRNTNRYLQEVDEDYARPLAMRRFASSWQMYDAHLYPGGAARLHMLRRHLGDAAFWAGVRAYLKQHAGQVVETDDLRKAFEAQSGASLVRFFDQWIYGSGYPDIHVEFEHDDDTKRGTFTIVQNQAKDDADKAFHFKTSVGWTIDGAHHTEAIEVTSARHVVVVPMDAAPEQVRFDPGATLVHKLTFSPGDDLLRRQLTDAPDIIGRCHAAHALAKTAKAVNLKALGAAYRSEPFWGVRQQILKALQEVGTSAAMELLIDLLAKTRDPMVLRDAFVALGAYRDPKVRAALEARLDEGALPYLAHAGAYEALGRQRADAPVERLKAAAATPIDPKGFVQGAAARALAAPRDAALLDAIWPLTVYGAAPLRVRNDAMVAAGALGAALAPHLRAPIRERLEDLLRDPEPRARQGAARALGALGDPAAAPALEALKATLSHQDAVELDATIRGLRASAQPRTAALTKQVETLTSALRKLEERLQALEAKGDADDANADDGGDSGDGGDGDSDASSDDAPQAHDAADAETVASSADDVAVSDDASNAVEDDRDAASAGALSALDDADEDGQDDEARDSDIDGEYDDDDDEEDNDEEMIVASKSKKKKDKKEKKAKKEKKEKKAKKKDKKGKKSKGKKG